MTINAKILGAPIVALSILISGCAVNQQGQVVPNSEVFGKKTIIPLGGGLLGAAICNRLFKGHGSREGWTAACGAAGYFASTAFVKQHNSALENNRVNETTRWSDPDGKNYTVTPTRTYAENGAPCRDFRQTVEINGQTEILTGTACRQNDGSWKLES